MWGSAPTDHSVKENHVIDWESDKIGEKEREDLAQGIKEAIYIYIYIMKLPNLNWEEGRYYLSHLYDNLLGGSPSTSRGGREQRLQELAQYHHHLPVIYLL